MSDAVVRRCLSKARFPDEHVARARALQLIDAKESDRDELWVYGCPHCRGWHMTKSPSPSPSITPGNMYTPLRGRPGVRR